MNTTDTNSPIETTRPTAPAPKLLAWLGLAFTLLGGVSYFLLMSIPWIRSSALPNTVLVGVGLLLSLMAIFKKPGLLTILTGVPSVLVGVGFLLSVFVLMKLPEAKPGLAVGAQPPALSLPNQDGKSVSLTDYRGKGPVLLVFYRGHW